ncbi:thioredoxin domain-containing protein 2-like [Macrosteles quadrilineatus]|uniref:thioredoxin domain-containing protein 2-like n=1 Tax=Macrosteles quadrilineatus TaxID=74068 RepID=UPI0023E1272B|nr:thioredoxin domain-containing protein 2-like [Macrosteles quadrilineatus]
MNMLIFHLTFLMILLQVVQGPFPRWWPSSKKRSGKSESQLENNEPKPSNIHTVTSEIYLSNKLKEAEQNQQMVVIEFFLTWYGPCKFIEPYFTGYAKRFPDVIFLMVDIDKQDKITNKYKIDVGSLPTFKFIKKRASESESIVETTIGTDKTDFAKKFYKMSEASIHVVIHDSYYAYLLNEAIKNGQLAVISFLSKECEHCKDITPFIEEYAKQHKDAIFIEVDVNELKYTADLYKVEEVPTFQFIKYEERKKVIGANKEDFKNTFKVLNELQ